MADERAFDITAPPLRVTDPSAPAGSERLFKEYPRHLHRADGSYIEVRNDIDKAHKLAEGWFLSREAAIEAASVAEPAAVSEPAAPVVRRGRKPKASVAEPAA